MSQPTSSTGILIRGSALSFAVSIAIGLINYFTRRILALDLPSAEAYGFFYSAFSLVMLFLAYLDLGLNNSCTILVAKYSARGDAHQAGGLFTRFLGIKLVAGLVVGGGLALATPWLIHRYFDYPPGRVAFLVLCGFIPINAGCGMVVAAMDARQDFLARNAFQAVKFAVVLIGVLAFPLAANLLAPSLAYAASAILTLPLGLVYLARRHDIRLDFRHLQGGAESWREPWQMGRWIALSSAGVTTMFYMDTLMLTLLKGLSSVAIYNIALPIMQMMQSVMILPAVFTPIATGLFHRHRLEELRRLTCDLVEISLLLLGFIAFATAFTARHLITLLFSADYLAATVPLIILCTGMAVLVLAQILCAGLNAMGLARRASLQVGVAVGVNLAANVVFIPWLDVTGAAMASASSYVVVAILAYRALDAELHLAFPFRRLAPAVLTAALAVTAAILLRPQLSLPGLVLASILYGLVVVWRHGDLGRRLARELRPTSGGKAP